MSAETKRCPRCRRRLKKLDKYKRNQTCYKCYKCGFLGYYEDKSWWAKQKEEARILEKRTIKW